MQTSERLTCEECGYTCSKGQQLNLMPSNPLRRLIAFTPEPALRPSEAVDLIDTSAPDITYDGPMPGRDSRELLSQLMSSGASARNVLEIGCGPKDQSSCFAHLGIVHVGIDVSGQAPDALADAHYLPFEDSQFDAVFSYAVLEHLHNPIAAMAEISRVLRPGGVFVGTVSLGEPFHASYFHHTPWALVALCRQTGFTIERLWSSMDTLKSLSRMGRYPRLLRYLLSFSDYLNRTLSPLSPHRRKWTPKENQVDSLYRAGSICFSLKKNIASTNNVMSVAK